MISKTKTFRMVTQGGQAVYNTRKLGKVSLDWKNSDGTPRQFVTAYGWDSDRFRENRLINCEGQIQLCLKWVEVEPSEFIKA